MPKCGRDVLLCAEGVVVGGAGLFEQALSAAGGGAECGAAKTDGDEGANASDRGRVSDVAEGVLASVLLDAADGVELLRVAGVAEVSFEADPWLDDVAQGDECAEGVAGGDGQRERGLRAGRDGAGGGLIEDTDAADGEIDAVQLAAEGCGGGLRLSGWSRESCQQAKQETPDTRRAGHIQHQAETPLYENYCLFSLLCVAVWRGRG